MTAAAKLAASHSCHFDVLHFWLVGFSGGGVGSAKVKILENMHDWAFGPGAFADYY